MRKHGREWQQWQLVPPQSLKLAVVSVSPLHIQAPQTKQQQLPKDGNRMTGPSHAIDANKGESWAAEGSCSSLLFYHNLQGPWQAGLVMTLTFLARSMLPSRRQTPAALPFSTTI